MGGENRDMQKIIRLSSHQHERCGDKAATDSFLPSWCRCHLLPQGSFAPRPSPEPRQNHVYFLLSPPCTHNGSAWWAGQLSSAETWGLLAGAISQELLLEPVTSCSVFCLCSPGHSGFDFCQPAQYKDHKATGCTNIIVAWSLGENGL